MVAAGPARWDAVVTALPFAFDFDSELRRGMAEARIPARKRRGAVGVNHFHADTCLFYAGVLVTLSVWLLVRRFTGSSMEFIGM